MGLCLCIGVCVCLAGSTIVSAYVTSRVIREIENDAMDNHDSKM